MSHQKSKPFSTRLPILPSCAPLPRSTAHRIVIPGRSQAYSFSQLRWKLCRRSWIQPMVRRHRMWSAVSQNYAWPLKIPLRIGWSWKRNGCLIWTQSCSAKICHRWARLAAKTSTASGVDLTLTALVVMKPYAQRHQDRHLKHVYGVILHCWMSGLWYAAMTIL